MQEVVPVEFVPFHIGIVTDDLERSMRELSLAFGVSWSEPHAPGGTLRNVDGVEQPRCVSCFSRGGTVQLNLMEGVPGTMWESQGAKVHHLAYWTDDLSRDIENLTREGWRLEVTQADDAGDPSVFAYLIRGDGLRIELLDSVNREAYFAAQAQRAFL
jgi:glyoxalase/bleomycin resistance protein/dioxygenase superfamily protein